MMRNLKKIILEEIDDLGWMDDVKPTKRQEKTFFNKEKYQTTTDYTDVEVGDRFIPSGGYKVWTVFAKQLRYGKVGSEKGWVYSLGVKDENGRMKVTYMPFINHKEHGIMNLTRRPWAKIISINESDDWGWADDIVPYSVENPDVGMKWTHSQDNPPIVYTIVKITDQFMYLDFNQNGEGYIKHEPYSLKTYYESVDNGQVTMVNNISINESDELSWMDSVPTHQKIFVTIEEKDEAGYLLSVLEQGGYRYISQSAKYRADRLGSKFLDEYWVVGVIVNAYNKTINRIIYNTDLRYRDSGFTAKHTNEFLDKIPHIDHRAFIDEHIDSDYSI